MPNLRAMPEGCRFAPRCDRAMSRCHAEKPALRNLGGGHLCRCFKTDGIEN
ncbi:MAG: oligopeptide/dipeptide ABC transporter ATP-binding protein [bacterium]